MKNPECPKCNSAKEVILLPSTINILGGIQPSSVIGSIGGLLFSSILSTKNKNTDTPHSQFKCNNCNERFRK